MSTLHIEHAITDFNTWKSAFDRFAEIRQSSGVRHHRVQRPLDDQRYVVVSLDFDTSQQAEAFLRFLRENVWPAPDRAPALIGTPQTRILDTVEER
jgi:hypothetical protein